MSIAVPYSFHTEMQTAGTRRYCGARSIPQKHTFSVEVSLCVKIDVTSIAARVGMQENVSLIVEILKF